MAKNFLRQIKGKKGAAEKSWLTKSGQVVTTQGQTQKNGDQEQQNSKQRGEGLKTLAKVLAIALIPLGVLGVEISIYYSVSQLSEEQIDDAQQVELKQPRPLLLLLLIGAGATASGALAALWASRVLHSAKIRKKAAQKKESKKESTSTETIQLLTNATAKIRAALNQEELLQTAVQEARQAIVADRVIFYSLEEQSQGKVIAESVDLRYPQALGVQLDDPCFKAYYLEKYQNGRVQATDDIYQANLTDCHIAQLEPWAIKANLVVPILTQGKLSGLLIAHHCAAPHAWRQSEIDIMRQIAQQVGLVLDNAKLLKASDRFQRQKATETKRIQSLTKATEKIRAALNQEELLQTAVQEARQVIVADRVVFYSLEEQSQGQIIAESVDFKYPQALGAQLDDPCFKAYYLEKYQNGRVQATDDIYQANLTACHIAQLEPLAVKANLVVPILTQGKLVGLLIAHHCAAPHGWQPLEIEVMVQIAQQVGLTIEGAHLVTEVAQVAKVFLEQLPTVADVARGVLDNAQQAHSQVQQTSQIIKAGCKVANQTVDELAELQENMAQTVNKINYVDKSSRQISQLVTLIEQLVAEINLQGTNILIKARKMGEDTPSSPPSALAQNLKSLREDLAEATAAIQSLVSTISTQVNDLNLSLKAKTEKVVKGTEGVEATRQKLHQIDGVTAQMSMLLGNIINVTGQGIETFTATGQAIVETTNLVPQNLEQFEVVVDSLTKLVEVSQQAQAGLVSSKNTPQNSQERDESKL